MGFKKILELCKENCMDKEKYIEILKDMELPAPSVSSQVLNITNNLKKSSNIEGGLLDTHSDNPYVRMSVGEFYLYTNLWKRIKDSGLGHLSEFRLAGNSYQIVISVNPGLMKDDDETKEEFKEREELFYKTCPYDIVDKKFGRQIADTQKNRDMLNDWLKSFIGFYYYEVISKNGFIYSIKMFTKSILLYKEKEKPEKQFNKASVEQIEKLCKDAEEAKEIKSCLNREEIDSAANSLISSAYCHICKLLSYDNEYCQKYRIILPSTGAEVEKAKKELGKQVPQEEILETFKELSKKMSDMFAKTAKFFLSDCSWHNGVFHFKGKFSSDIDMFYSKNFFNEVLKFDDIAENMKTEYLIRVEHIAYVKEVFEKEYHCIRISMEVEDRDGEMFIKSISGMILNPLDLSL